MPARTRADAGGHRRAAHGRVLGKAHARQRQRGADQQLEGAEGQQVEGRGGIDPQHRLAGDERDEEEAADHEGQRLRPPAVAEHHQRREHEVELLLDAQRPVVQQRHLLRRRAEIVGAAVEIDVAEGERRPDQRTGEADQLRREQEEDRDDGGDRADHEEGRHDAPHPPLVEAEDREAAFRGLGIDRLGDQEAGDDEEHVDADEAAGQPVRAEMEQHHAEHGDGAQSVDMGAVAEADGARGRELDRDERGGPRECADGGRCRD